MASCRRRSRDRSRSPGRQPASIRIRLPPRQPPHPSVSVSCSVSLDSIICSPGVAESIAPTRPGSDREPAPGGDGDGPVDVAIIGGGPAGSSAARLLSAWGHSVLLLAKSEAGTPSLAESLPPSCRKVFEAIGVREAVERAGFVTTGGNTVCWGAGPPRVASFGGGRVGYQVLRRDFDRLLLDEARRAGAVVRTGVTVRRVANGQDGPMVVAGRDERERAVTASARIVLDCSGRAGVIARRHRTRLQAAETTLALVGIWRRDGGGAFAGPASASGVEPGGEPGDASHTVVEAYADGWAWSVPLSERRRYVTVMVDPRTTETDHPGSLAARYRAEVGKTVHLARLAAGASLEGEPWACDASQYGSRRFGGPGYLLVGDAATFIDPLSSFGVKKAMASAWLASVVANTCLLHPTRADLALRFHAEREQEVWDAYRRQSSEFFAQVSQHELHPFWSDRSDPMAMDGVRSRAGGPDAVEAFRRDPAVRSAFDALRRAPSIRLRPTDAVRTTSAPAVEGREIVADACLSLDAGKAGAIAIRYLRGVDLLALVEIAESRTEVPDLYEAYCGSRAPVDLADFLGALAVLLGRGVLRNEA
ncbi:MAG: NAD(P)/FAD-dependent oxidoreductase [Acidobacteria bacterium]|nr:NAD(P)/FAD-dependent oxidoreductase [Acidobacteriota bacterium]